MQEQLAVEHFKLDKEKTGALYDDPNSLEKFKGLMNSMSALSEEIKKLHQEDGVTSPSTASWDGLLVVRDVVWMDRDSTKLKKLLNQYSNTNCELQYYNGLLVDRS